MKHLFFDLDHTLWDFETNSEKALSILYDEYNLKNNFNSYEGFLKVYKKINGKLWYQYGKGQITKEELRIRRFYDTLKRFKTDDNELAQKLAIDYLKISPYQTALFPNAIKTLEALKNDDYSMHIITNGFLEVQHIKLEKSGLKDFFDVIVCSEEVGINKPGKEVFHHSLELAKAKPTESIMIGDDLRCDVIGAEKVGMKGILFDPHESYKENTHEWQIDKLDKIPEIIPWIIKSTL